MSGNFVSMPTTVELLNVREVAEILGVSQRTVWRWVDQGRLRTVRVGPKLVRFRRVDLDAITRSKNGRRR